MQRMWEQREYQADALYVWPTDTWIQCYYCGRWVIKRYPTWLAYLNHLWERHFYWKFEWGPMAIRKRLYGQSQQTRKILATRRLVRGNYRRSRGYRWAGI